MSYLVLARRFRPQTFDEIVGQEHVTRTLKNAIGSDRVAHAFLFSGARGVGKTTAARVLAKALNCVEGPTDTPCGVCAQCTGIAESRAVDVQEIDGASNNSVDDVRALRETVPYRPASGRFKIYIVDEVHMLTTSAFNALLKTLEEPPAHVKFIFATTEPHKIPVTILSRCQRYDFRLIPTAQIQARLKEITDSEAVRAEPAALSLLAREAAGSMRDALSLLDQTLAFNASELEASEVARLLGVADRQILLAISGALLDGDAAAALKAVESAVTFGVDLTRFSHDLLRHLRNLVVARQCPRDRDLIDLSDEEVEELAAQIQGRNVAELHRLFLLFSKSSEEISRSPQPKLLLEMTLARLASLEPMMALAELAQRLEQGGGQGGGIGGIGGPPPGGSAPPPRTPPARSPRSNSASRLDAPPQRAPQGLIRNNRDKLRRTGVSDQGAMSGAERGSVTEERRRAGASGPGDRRDYFLSDPNKLAAEAPPATRQPPEARSEAPHPSASSGPAQPSPPAAPPQGTPKQLWRRVLDHIQQVSPSQFHIFRLAKPLELTAQSVHVSLPDSPFNRDMAKDASAAEKLAGFCSAVLGQAPQVKLEIERTSGPNAIEREHIEKAAKAQSQRREVKDHAMVRAMLREFDGAKIEEIKIYKDKT